MWGNAGNDVLLGRGGNDTLYGGTGSDTYYFGVGYGDDVVVNQDADATTTDIIRIAGTGYAPSSIWFARQGNDLIVSLLATSDTMKVQNWYVDTASKVDQFIATDGKILRTAGVQQLVNAMASFSPSTAVGGTGIQPGAIPTAVQTAINSAWTAT